MFDGKTLFARKHRQKSDPVLQQARQIEQNAAIAATGVSPMRDIAPYRIDHSMTAGEPVPNVVRWPAEQFVATWRMPGLQLLEQAPLDQSAGC
jgi:hypothetical protein